MSDSPLAYLYQLQDATYSYLDQLSFSVAVVDIDDSALTAEQLSGLQDDGKIIFSYLSIGEAEDYRSYWNEDWESNEPDFILQENPDWAGNYKVKFWETEWQQIIFSQAEKIVNQGYQGMYLDIVDAYSDAEVISAYSGQDLRQEMESFVISLSAYVKALNPDFKVITQNAVGLMALDDDAQYANTRFLDAIDGLGVEDLFYNDNSVSDWTPWDLEFIRLAQADGKFVLATSYPTISSRQSDFLEQSLNESFIPFVATRELDGSIADSNYQIAQQLPEGWLDLLQSAAEEFQPEVDFSGTDSSDELIGSASDERFAGFAGEDSIDGSGGLDTAVYSSAYADYLVTNSDGLLNIQSLSASDGDDLLLNIERLEFSEHGLAFDLSGNAGQAYRIYQAAFDRTPDQPGLGYWITQMDNGMDVEEVAARFLDSGEFQSLYGLDPSTGDLVDAIYENVLHRTPDEEGRAFYVAQIDNGLKSIEKTLADFSESEENQLQVIGDIQSGILYDLWNG